MEGARTVYKDREEARKPLEVFCTNGTLQQVDKKTCIVLERGSALVATHTHTNQPLTLEQNRNSGW